MEENKIQEAEIISEPAADNLDQNIVAEKQESEKKSKFRNKLILIFVLGFLLGIVFKMEALRKITIGYNDYLMKIKTQDYNINQMQEDLSKRISSSEEATADEAEEMQAQDEAGNADGAESDLAPEESQEIINQTSE